MMGYVKMQNPFLAVLFRYIVVSRGSVLRMTAVNLSAVPKGVLIIDVYLQRSTVDGYVWKSL